MSSQNRMYQRQNGCGCPEARATERETMCQMRRGYESMPIAMAYVPWQEKGELYSPCKALSEGTAFPELNLIFCGVRG